MRFAGTGSFKRRYNVSTIDEDGFEWDADNLGKTASHKVSATEAEEAILNDPIY
jgi:hypothetical protein